MAAKKGVKIVSDVALAEGVNATVSGSTVTLKGAAGENSANFTSKEIVISVADNKVHLEAARGGLRSKKMIKTYAAHLKNMVKGANEGHKYTLKICSGHFPMNVAVSNNQLVVKNFLGEKIPRSLNLKQGATVTVDGDQITVESNSKDLAGQVSADIEALTKRRGYDTRIFQDGIYITEKDGKKL